MNIYLHLDRCTGSCNTLNDLSNRICSPNEREDVNLSFFNLIAGINESKGLTKHISCECKFDGRNWDSNSKGNNDNCRCGFKNLKERDVCKKR